VRIVRVFCTSDPYARKVRGVYSLLLKCGGVFVLMSIFNEEEKEELDSALERHGDR
jgi:hypothetical protein